MREYILPIRPRSKARPRSTRGGPVYMPKPYMAWKREVRSMMADLYDPVPIQGRVRLEVAFRFPTEPAGDKDNLVGGLMDALQGDGPGCLWLDDKQIIDQRGYWEPSWEKVIALRVEEAAVPELPPKPKKPRKRGAA